MKQKVVVNISAKFTDKQEDQTFEYKMLVMTLESFLWGIDFAEVEQGAESAVLWRSMDLLNN